jgi:1-deoxy-D-xylulose-5-phosphate reductoisomerase
LDTKKRIAILGSTGSIGRQALDVIKAHPGLFEVEVLSAWSNKDLLVRQAIKHRPNAVVIGNETYYKEVSDALSSHDIKVFAGEDAVSQIVQYDNIDMVLNAIVGYAGFLPTINTIKAGKTLALANKESLVVGGALVTGLAQDHKAPIIPVDSEHSAIFQCMAGEDFNEVEKIILTASGGPFFGMSEDELKVVTRDEALRHPNWSMGKKITIDSATMMNKGLEVIEAKWLFGLQPRQIEVVIHPQSIIHSMVQFHDGSLKAQMGLPDMQLPIQYALGYPGRLKSGFGRYDFARGDDLTFHSPDIENFRNLALAYEALESGGNACCVLNAANEVAVEAFLGDQIKFLDIPEVIQHCLDNVSFLSKPGYDDLVNTDAEARAKALEKISTP